MFELFLSSVSPWTDLVGGVGSYQSKCHLNKLIQFTQLKDSRKTHSGIISEYHVKKNANLYKEILTVYDKVDF